VGAQASRTGGGDDCELRHVSFAYAGTPLITPGGQVLGTICAIDHEPRHWTSEQVDILSNLAGSVLSEIQLHAAQRNQGQPVRGRGGTSLPPAALGPASGWG
jgi:GAF domain-containing protein